MSELTATATKASQVCSGAQALRSTSGEQWVTFCADTLRASSRTLLPPRASAETSHTFLSLSNCHLEITCGLHWIALRGASMRQLLFWMNHERDEAFPKFSLETLFLFPQWDMPLHSRESILQVPSKGMVSFVESAVEIYKYE